MKIKKQALFVVLIVSLSLLFLSNCEQVEEIAGCTVETASNYDAAATYNDGSCTSYTLSEETKVLLSSFSTLPSLQ